MADVQAILEAFRRKEPDGGLQAELQSERASSLGRAGRKLGHAVRMARAAFDALGPDPLPEALSAYRTAREAALEARWEMIVTRECCGLWPHDEVDRTWSIPPAR